MSGVERVGDLDGQVEQTIELHAFPGDGVLESLAVENSMAMKALSSASPIS